MEKYMEKEISSIFDNFIKSGYLTKEKEVVPGLKVKVKVLNTGELLAAQTIMSHENAPSDIVVKLRAASILSQCLLEFDGTKVVPDICDEREERARRVLLYSKLLQMPSLVIQKMYELYLEAVKDQNNKYSDLSKTGEEIENF